MPESKHDQDTDDVLVVEAANAELALAEVTSTLGPAARIVRAEKVLRGGIGGFFAKELVQLEAERPPSESGPTASLEDVLRNLRDGVDTEERSFADVLRAQLAPAEPAAVATAVEPAAVATAVEPAPVATAVEPAPVAPVPAPASPPPHIHAQPVWSVVNLHRLGLPPLVAKAVRSLDPGDDTAWVTAIARAVAPLCRPLPSGPQLLTGPRAELLARALDVPLLVPDASAAPGDVAVMLDDGQQSRSRLAGARGERWLHLAIGGVGWRRLLFDEPAALSWVGDGTLPEALTLCASLDLPLGYGVDDRGVASRARPVDIAMAIRVLLPWR